MRMISSLCCLPLSLFALPRSTDPSRAVFMWTSDPKVNIHAQRSHLALPHLVCLVPLSPPPRATRWTPWRRRSCPKKSILSRDGQARCLAHRPPPFSFQAHSLGCNYGSGGPLLSLLPPKAVQAFEPPSPPSTAHCHISQIHHSA